MRVLLISAGSRGDVDPFVALACGLKQAGHFPTLAAPARFHTLAQAQGIAFIGLDNSLFELQEGLARRGTFAALAGATKAKPALRKFLLDVAGLAEHATDYIVYHPKTLAAPLVAEKQGVPSIAAQLVPLYQPTRAFPAPVLAQKLPRWLHGPSWRLVVAIEAPWRGLMRDIHHRLGLTTPRIGLAERIADGGALNAWSSRLLPAPADWPAGSEPLGFWRLPADGDAQPPQVLADFLAAGPAPVYIGFGSMLNRDSARLGRHIRDGLRRAGSRGVVATGAGAIEIETSDDILVLEHAPHQWLFPRVKTVVHHGGIGTVAAALGAGVPQVIKPFLGDQPFWARRLHEVQAGIPLDTLTPDSFARGISAAEGLTQTARSIAQEMACESGVSTAIERIERHALRP